MTGEGGKEVKAYRPGEIPRLLKGHTEDGDGKPERGNERENLDEREK